MAPGMTAEVAAAEPAAGEDLCTTCISTQISVACQALLIRALLGRCLQALAPLISRGRTGLWRSTEACFSQGAEKQRLLVKPLAHISRCACESTLEALVGRPLFRQQVMHVFSLAGNRALESSNQRRNISRARAAAA